MLVKPLMDSVATIMVDRIVGNISTVPLSKAAV
jgi:hypothetical protein